jgi:hypothetical protein
VVLARVIGPVSKADADESSRPRPGTAPGSGQNASRAMGGRADRESPVIVQQAHLASYAFGAYRTVLIVLLEDLPDWVPC